MQRYIYVLILLLCLHLIGCGKQTDNSADNPGISKQTPNQVSKSPPLPSAPTPSAGDKSPAATSAPEKGASFYFTRNSQHQAPVIPAAAARLMSSCDAFYIVPNSENKVYLTFDCGYELGYTTQILDTLQNEQVPAAFFITGQYIKTQPGLVKRMHQEGHLVCNHTYNHPDLSTASKEKFTTEVNTLAAQYENLTGAPLDKYLRPPMGMYSENSLAWARELGYATVFWSIAMADWDPNKQPGADYARRHINDNIHPGAVILLHVVSQSDTDALHDIISDIRSQGYVFSTFGS